MSRLTEALQDKDNNKAHTAVCTCRLRDISGIVSAQLCADADVISNDVCLLTFAKKQE